MGNTSDTQPAATAATTDGANADATAAEVNSAGPATALIGGLTTATTDGADPDPSPTNVAETPATIPASPAEPAKTPDAEDATEEWQPYKFDNGFAAVVIKRDVKHGGSDVHYGINHFGSIVLNDRVGASVYGLDSAGVKALLKSLEGRSA